MQAAFRLRCAWITYGFSVARAGGSRGTAAGFSRHTCGARSVFLISIIYFNGPRAVRWPLAIFSVRLRRAQSMNFSDPQSPRINQIRGTQVIMSTHLPQYPNPNVKSTEHQLDTL